jgi:hypothetical protein
MTKFLAAANDPESLLARRARLNPETLDHARPAETRQEPKATPNDEPALDADMLDFVTRFEQNFAELAPTREEPQNGPLADDLFPEFPDQPFDTPPQRNRPRALELARFEPQPTRVAVAPDDARPVLTNDQLDIDEAFSILKAAEVQGAAKAQQAEDEQRVASAERAASAERELPAPDVALQMRNEPRTAWPQPAGGIERKDWASRSHKPRSIAVAGGVLVLALGLTAGYVAGRVPHGKSHAVIQTTAQGGTVLRLDTNLTKR